MMRRTMTMAMQMPVFDPWQTAFAYADALAVAQADATLWQRQRTRRLAALLQHAAACSPLYRQRLQRAGGDGDPWSTLSRLAPVAKPELMQRFAEWVTDARLELPALRAFVRQRGHAGEAFLGRYVVWESSGSSGEPALFVQDARCLAVCDALEAARGPVSLFAAAQGWWHGPPRIALVGATDGPYASVIAFERARALNPWLGAASGCFSFLQPVQRLAEQLEAFAPTVLASYPSMAWVLADEQRCGRLRLALQAVWTGGETLTPATRRAIAAAFGAPVHDSYGASECFVIADECRYGRLHLNADWVLLEPVDERGRVLPDGETGHTTLLTNLANQVQPILRYDLGDRVRIVPQRCDCGSSLPLIEVQGRCDDLLTLRDADGRAVHLSPLALITVLEEEAGVFDFRLRQHGARALQLSLDDPHAATRALQVLRGFLRERGLGATRVELAGGEPPEACRGHSGKRQRVVADQSA